MNISNKHKTVWKYHYYTGAYNAPGASLTWLFGNEYFYYVKNKLQNVVIRLAQEKEKENKL